LFDDVNLSLSNALERDTVAHPFDAFTQNFLKRVGLSGEVCLRGDKAGGP